MRLWVLLFGMIWVVVAQFILALLPLASLANDDLLYGHAALGAVLVGLAVIAYREVGKTRAPSRVKRVARASLPVMGLMIATGPILFADAVEGTSIPGGTASFTLVLVLHVIGALALLAHTTATAVSYDMWEAHEFDEATEPDASPR